MVDRWALLTEARNFWQVVMSRRLLFSLEWNADRLEDELRCLRTQSNAIWTVNFKASETARVLFEGQHKLLCSLVVALWPLHNFIYSTMTSAMDHNSQHTFDSKVSESETNTTRLSNFIWMITPDSSLITDNGPSPHAESRFIEVNWCVKCAEVTQHIFSRFWACTCFTWYSR